MPQQIRMLQQIRIFRQFRYSLLFVSVIILSGCARSLVLETSAVSVPAPLVQALPFSAAVYFPDATRQHKYEDASRHGLSWSVATGTSHVSLFNQILKPMFSSTNEITDLKNVASEHDVVLIPKVLDMQFALPQETHLGYYEVWISYELSVMQPQGNTIATIPFRGYGKSGKQFLGKDDEGLRNAANMAFRDLGAKFIVSFLQNPQINTWRLSNVGTASAN